MTINIERIISGRGLLRIPDSADLRKAKRLVLFVDVIREPRNKYYNSNYNPPKGRYGTINLFRDGYQVQEICLEYPYQSFPFYPDPAAQTFYLAKCSYELLLAQLVEMSDKLGLLTNNSPNPFTDWWHTNYWWDEARVVCYADTGLRLTLKSEEFLLCPNDSDPQPPDQPPPPNEIPQIPPGTPLDGDTIPVSDPYQEPDDDGDTVPYEDDVPESDLPLGTACQIYRIDYTYLTTNGQTLSNFGFIKGKYFTNITFQFTGGSGYQFLIEAQAGSPTIQGIQQAVCQNTLAPRVFDTIAAAGIPVSATFVSATPQ